MGYGVALFHTTSSAMRGQKVLKAGGHKVKLIPTPRQFSSDCGISVRFDWDELPEVQTILEEAKVEVQSIRELE